MATATKPMAAAALCCLLLALASNVAVGMPTDIGGVVLDGAAAATSPDSASFLKRRDRKRRGTHYTNKRCDSDCDSNCDGCDYIGTSCDSSCDDSCDGGCGCRIGHGGSTCTTCGAGYYNDKRDYSIYSCKKQPICTAGRHIKVSGDHSRAEVCTNCETGKYSTSTNRGSCTPHHNCAAGLEVSVSPTSTRNRGCRNCAAGRISTKTNQGSCTSCAPGTKRVSPTTCQGCPIGQFNSKHNMSTCELCPYDHFQDHTGRAGCTKCPDGTFTSDKGASSQSQCEPLQVRVLGSTHRIWIGMHEKSSYDCLQVTLSAYDLAVSSSTPIQRLSEGPKLPLTVITPMAVASGTCTSAGLAPIDDDAGCTKAAAAISYKITWGPHGGYADVPRGCTVRSGSQLFRNTQAASSQNAPCSARNVCICQRPAATTPLAVITPTPSRLGKCQGDCYADSQCQAGLRCFQRELCKHSPSAGDCASNDSGSQGIAASAQACRARCAATPGCTHYVFWSHNKMCYPKKSCKLSSSDSRAQSYTMDCKNNAVIPGCTTSAPSSNRNFCYKPSQCTEKSVVQKGHSWLDFPLYRNKEQGNWARVNPGQYVRSEVKAIEQSANNAAVNAFSHITDRAHTTCGCVDNVKLVAQAKATSLEDLDCVRDGEELLDCVPYDMVESGTTPWSVDSIGTPGSLVATQHEGKVFFGWTDYSECESQFHFTRDSQSFVNDFAFTGSQRCGEAVKPEALYDDLILAAGAGDGGRAVGITHKYCVQAGSVIGAGAMSYRSGMSCTKDFAVAYNTRIDGHVLTKDARLPVEGATVTYTVQSTKAMGTTTSAKDGSFYFHILDTKAAAQIEDIDITFSKTTKSTTGPSDHLFICNGELCGPGTDNTTGKPYPPAVQTLRLSHLTFDNKLEILEASSIPFTGTVSFPAMPPHLLPRGADKPDSDAWPWTAQATGSARQCFIPEAEVCLLDHMRSDAAIVCAKTDPQGNFKLPAPVGLHVAVAIKYRSHEAFYRTASSTLDDVSANIDGKKRQHYVTTSKKATGGFGKASSIEVYHITEESDGLWVGMHFQDKTTRRAQLGAHGTLCKLPLGDAAVFNLQHAGGECYSNIAATRIDTRLHTDAEFLVPAHVFDVTFDKVVPAYPQVTDRSKVGYFHRLRNQTQRIDLLDDQATESSSSSSSSGNAAAIFTFHPKPILGIRFKDLQTKLVVAGAGCANATVSVDGNEADLLTDSQVPAWKFRAGQQVQAVVDVKAVLANGLGGCTHVEGNIQVHSRLGLSSEDQADLNKDKATADYVAIAKVLTRSIGSPSLVAGLSMCSSPLDSRCTLPLDHEVTTRVKVFGDETECLVTLDGRRANGYVAITAEDQCREQFARVASQSVSAATRAGKRVEHRQWHTLVWNSATEPSLTDAERTAWAALGAGAASWENATSWTSWKDFNDAVFGNGPASQAKTWTAMTAAHRNIASSVLGFSENSWGRTWLLKERIAHNNVELLDWVELRADERTHLAALGWMQSSWEAKQPVSSSPQSALKPWASLTAAMQRSASQLGFTQITWLPAQTDSQTVRGCFWDHATASLVFSRWSDERNASATPRFSAFCMQQEKRLAHVVKDLVVGMPDRLPPFSRTISAIMRQQGYPRTEETTSAVITGKRFKQDLERVPFPEGRPLLTLHDPPGGSSFAYYENARLETEFSKESNLVTTGHESESELAVGVRLEGIGATKLSTEVCVGLGASVCQGVEATMMGGGKFGIDALGKLDTVDHSTSGTASDETLQSKLSLTFSYSTSADVEKAGPESDAFLMPALTVEISEVLVVRMSNDAGSCAITGTIDKSWTVLGHLSAFWWITANDVEARVLPALDDLVAAGRFKQQCLAAPSAANCCDQYDAEVPGATACRMGGAVNGALVDSLHKYCSNRLQATSGQDYDNCMEVSEEQLNQVKEANKNWVGTLDRYYQPLKDIKAANEEGTTGLDDLCERASICKHTGLAPKSLIDAAQASNGDALDSEKKDEYREYNTISFVGGGSSMDHKYMLRSSATTKEVLNNDGNTEISRRGGGGAWVEARTPWAGFGGSAKTMHTGGTATIRTSSTVAAASDDSEAGFHLEDPDYGDYFVVQVFKDPVYGTPLFFTNGGASSCHHEQGTAERSSPSLEWKYVGPDNLKPDQPAIFKVTIANELGYYEGGVRGNVSRPFWSNDETGYVAPDMQLYVMPESLVDGIQLKVDGKPFLDSITFLEFGQKKHAMIVEVFRGPSAFTYTAPLIGWKEKCSGGHNTYGHTNVDTATGLNFYSLSMPTPETPSGVHDTAKAIRYMQPCSEVAWSGDILRDGAFLITGSGDTAMKFAVANPGLRSWDNDDRLQKLVMEYRRHECIGHTCWRDSGVALAHAGASFVTGQWQPPATDNEYDIRVTAQCKPSGNPDYDTASTPIVNGVVDREAPMVLSSHLDQLVGAQDVVVVEFSEPIECTPLFEMSFEYENLPAAPSTARDRTVVLSKSQGQITVSCKGSRIIASRPVDRGSDVVAGRTPTLRIAGVEDLAGNVPDPTALVIELVEGEAQRERKEIEADIVRVSAEASNQLAQVSAQSARRQTDLAAAVNKLLKRYGIRTTTNSTTSAAAAAAVEGAAKAMQQAEKDFVEAYTEQKDAEAEVIKAQQALETAKANGDAVVVAEGKEKLLASQNALALKRSAVVAASETKVKAKAAEAAAKSASAAASVAEASAAADAAAPSPSKDDDDDIKTLVIAVLIILVILVLVVLVVVKIAIDATAQKADNVNESRSSHFSAGLSTVRMGPGSDEYLAEASQTSGPHAQGGGVVTTVRGTDYFLASGGVSDMPVRNVSDMLADEVGVSQGGGGIPGARSDRSDASGEYLSTRQALVGADGPSFLDAVPELPAKARSLRVHSSFHSTRLANSMDEFGVRHSTRGRTSRASFSSNL